MWRRETTHSLIPMSFLLDKNDKINLMVNATMVGGIIEVVEVEEAMAKVEATITGYIILLHKGMYLFLSVSMLNNHFKVV